MSKVKFLSISLGLFLCLAPVANAATCGYETRAKLNGEVANVKANYEIATRVLDKSEYTVPDSILGTPEEETYVAYADYMKVNILNITEDLYAVVKENVNHTETRYDYSNTNNGNISIEWHDVYKMVEYTIYIYASSNTECEGTELKTLHVRLPRFNYYSLYDECTKVPGYYTCEPYVTFEEPAYNDFVNGITKEVKKIEEQERIEKENAKWYKKIGNFIGNHKVAFIAGGIILVGVAGTTTYVVIKRRRSDVK